MQVTSIHEVRGRGFVTVVNDLPNQGIILGILVHQNGHAWKLVGVESGWGRKDVGLLLKPLDGAPQAPEEGEIFL